MIDYSKVHLYFDLSDPLSHEFLSDLNTRIRLTNKVIHDNLNNKIGSLIKSSNYDLNLDYSYEAYNYHFKAAYDSGIEVTPILISYLLNEDIKQLKDIHKGFRYTNIKDLDSFNIEFNNQLELIKFDTMYAFAVKVGLATREVEIVNKVFNLLTELIDITNDNIIENYSDRIKIINELVEFNGKYEEVRAILQREVKNI